MYCLGIAMEFAPRAQLEGIIIFWQVPHTRWEIKNKQIVCIACKIWNIKEVELLFLDTKLLQVFRANLISVWNLFFSCACRTKLKAKEGKNRFNQKSPLKHWEIHFRQLPNGQHFLLSHTQTPTSNGLKSKRCAPKSTSIYTCSCTHTHTQTHFSMHDCMCGAYSDVRKCNNLQRVMPKETQTQLQTHT